MNEKQIAALVEEVIRQIQEEQQKRAGASEAHIDIASAECKAIPLIDAPENPGALARMKRETNARIGVGPDRAEAENTDAAYPSGGSRSGKGRGICRCSAQDAGGFRPVYGTDHV